MSESSKILIQEKVLSKNDKIAAGLRARFSKDKILALNLRHRSSEWTRCADKVAVREYVRERVGERYLVPLLGVYEDARDLPVDSLPDHFIVKAAHASGWNLLVRDKRAVDWTTKNLPLDHAVPALLLQPLLENAVYYGIEPQPEGGRIEVLGTFNKGVLRLEVRNPLPATVGYARQDGNRMALANIRQRLRLAYGESARLESEERDGWFRVRLMIPLETGK